MDIVQEVIVVMSVSTLGGHVDNQDHFTLQVLEVERFAINVGSCQEVKVQVGGQGQGQSKEETPLQHCEYQRLKHLLGIRAKSMSSVAIQSSHCSSWFHSIALLLFHHGIDCKKLFNWFFSVFISWKYIFIKLIMFRRIKNSYHIYLESVTTRWRCTSADFSAAWKKTLRHHQRVQDVQAQDEVLLRGLGGLQNGLRGRSEESLSTDGLENASR